MITRRLSLTVLLVLATLPAAGMAACKIGSLAVLPVTMKRAQPLVPAKINGTAVQFLADSGAFYSVISPASAAALNLRTEQAPLGFALTGLGGDTRAMVATVKEFTLSGGTSSNVQFIVGGNDMGGGVVGILGQNILSLADVEYDLGGGAIRLIRADGCEDSEKVYWAKAAPFSVVRIDPPSAQAPHVIGTALLNGKRIRVLFDTGASNSILTVRAAERAGVKTDDKGVVQAGRMRGIGARISQTWLATFDSFKIGDEEIRNTRLRIGDMDIADADMLLGADFFLSHRVYVSNSARKVLFTYNGGPVFDLSAAQNAAESAELPAAAGAAADTREPADAAGYARRGAMYASRRDYPRAIADLTRATELAPGEAEHFYQRGRLYVDNQQPRLAVADFDQALKLNDFHIEARLARAGLRLSRFEATGQGELEVIIADLDRVAAAVPKESDLRLELSTLYARAAAFPAAVAQIDQWLEQHREDSRAPDAFASRCRARGMMGQDLDKALSDCNRAARDRKGVPFVFDSRGLIHLRQRDYDKAIEDYNTALAVQPRNPWALYGRGLARLGKGQKAEGEADIAMVKASNPRVVADAVKRGLVP
jgi:tetratricopeptide (TPR) repeat protein